MKTFSTLSLLTGATLLASGCSNNTELLGDGSADFTENVCDEVPVGDVYLPQDEAAHGTPIEWWYWTGHLHALDGSDRWFGFEESFFSNTLGPASARMVHTAITDIDAGEFHYSNHRRLGGYSYEEDGYTLYAAGQSADGANGTDVLHGEVDNYQFDLSLINTKRPVLQHGDGFFNYPWGGDTGYYSRARMQATGSIVKDGEVIPVEGTAWFDHQWLHLGGAGNYIDLLNVDYLNLFRGANGWNWVAIQLDDGTELLAFHFLEGEDTLLTQGSFADTNCQVKTLNEQDITMTPIGEWESPESGCVYPAAWDIEYMGKTYHVDPVMPNQELNTLPIRYWEGAATVSGAGTGRAYVEMVGHCN